MVGSAAPRGQAITAIATAITTCSECPTTLVQRRCPAVGYGEQAFGGTESEQER